MGAESLETAVADSGPLIHLTQIGAISFLRVFAQIPADGLVGNCRQRPSERKRYFHFRQHQIGIVIRAYKAGQISLEEATRRISDLQTNSTLFVTRAIMDLAIEELHRRVNIN